MGGKEEVADAKGVKKDARGKAANGKEAATPTESETASPGVPTPALLGKAHLKLRHGLGGAITLDELCEMIGLAKQKGKDLTLGEHLCEIPGVARVEGKGSTFKFYRISNAALEGAISVAVAAGEEVAQVIGEFIFPYVEQWYGGAASKLTGMLLEMGAPDLLHLTEDVVALNAKLDEALTVLVEAGHLPASMRPKRKDQFAHVGESNVPWSGMASGIIPQGEDPSAPTQQQQRNNQNAKGATTTKQHTNTHSNKQKKNYKKSPWNRKVKFSAEAIPFVHISGDWPSLPTESESFQMQIQGGRLKGGEGGENESNKQEQEIVDDYEDYEYESEGEGRVVLGGDDMLDEFEDYQADDMASLDYYDDGVVEEPDERDKVLSTLQAQSKGVAAKEVGKVSTSEVVPLPKKYSSENRNQKNIRMKSHQQKQEEEEEAKGEEENKGACEEKQQDEESASNLNTLLEELDSLCKPASS